MFAQLIWIIFLERLVWLLLIRVEVWHQRILFKADVSRTYILYLIYFRNFQWDAFKYAILLIDLLFLLLHFNIIEYMLLICWLQTKDTSKKQCKFFCMIVYCWIVILLFTLWLIQVVYSCLQVVHSKMKVNMWAKNMSRSPGFIVILGTYSVIWIDYNRQRN